MAATTTKTGPGKRWRRALGHCVIVVLLPLLAVSVSAEPDTSPAAPSIILENPEDPWEGLNRKIFAFNEFADKYALKPIANSYDAVMPQFASDGVTNFFTNIGLVRTVFNDVLQLNLLDAAKGSVGFLLNTTVGLFGVIDVATPAGLAVPKNDLGQTLGRWGIGPGPYLVVPFWGPSTVRDAISIYPDNFAYGVNYIDDVPVRNSLWALDIIDNRSNLFKAEELVSGDRYTFLRDAYLQRRQYLIQQAKGEDSDGIEALEQGTFGGDDFTDELDDF